MCCGVWKSGSPRTRAMTLVMPAPIFSILVRNEPASSTIRGARLSRTKLISMHPLAGDKGHAHILEREQVLVGLAVDHDNVGGLAGLHRSDQLVELGQLRGPDGARTQGVEAVRADADLNHDIELGRDGGGLDRRAAGVRAEYDRHTGLGSFDQTAEPALVGVGLLPLLDLPFRDGVL